MSDAVMVSIGIPNYNYSNYIVAALNSVINQTYRHIEIVIIDDCSTDNSVTVIEDWISKYKGPYEIIFIKNAINQGLTGVCNQVLQRAGGKYFQTLDADDLLLPEKIEKQVRLMEESQNIALVYSNIGVIDEGGKIVDGDYLARIGYNKNDMPQGKIFEQLFSFNFIPLPSVLINTAFARMVGGFDSTLQVQDYYLWLKLAENHEVLYMFENTAFYRAHSGSMSSSSVTNPKSFDSILNIKFRYYKSASESIKKLIRKDIHSFGIYLYRASYPTAGYWLKKNVLLNPGFKSTIYYIAFSLGMPLNLFEKIKSRLYKGF